MFIDKVQLSLRAGRGGNGLVAWRREKYIPKGGPAGGNGGNGGAVYIKADNQILSLQDYRNKRLMRAQNGAQGGANNRQGKRGQDLTIHVPCGTIVKSGDEILFDLSEDGQTEILCKGGRGGKGNTCFKSPTNQAPNYATPGTEGENLDVELELKMIADVGFVGLPNSGKSTLLSKITHSPAKTGAYPFTTLKPNLSLIQREDYSRVFIADIPGIIKDAHQDRGLGLSFLKHIERTSVLLLIIDLSGIDGRDPFEDFLTLQSELKEYSDDLAEKPFLVALNKIDAPSSEENRKDFYKRYPFDPNTIIEISALEEKNLPNLTTTICDLAQQNGKHF